MIHMDCALLSDKDSLDLLLLVVHMDCSKRCIGGVPVEEDDRCCDLERMDDADLLGIASGYRRSTVGIVGKDVLLAWWEDVVPLEGKAGWWAEVR